MKPTVEEYKRYTIRSGAISGQFGANGYLRKKLLAQCRSATLEDAVAQCKIELDRIDALELSERDDEGAPSAQAYEEAFLALGDLTDGYEAMLKAHLRAPNQLITATKLAEAAGYQNYNAANLHYGTLGMRVGRLVGYTPVSRANGDPVWTCVLSRNPDSDTSFHDTDMVEGLANAMESGHFEWQMRPQVADALRKLGYK